MLLKAGQNIYVLPEPIELNFTRMYTYEQGGSAEHPIEHVHLVVNARAQDMEEMKEVPPGRPTRYRVLNTSAPNPKLQIAPSPDRDYFTKFVYCPKEKVL